MISPLSKNFLIEVQKVQLYALQYHAKLKTTKSSSTLLDSPDRLYGRMATWENHMGLKQYNSSCVYKIMPIMTGQYIITGRVGTRYFNF